jgi:hypothetical protein
MSIVWEDPPKAARGPASFGERSPLRKEVDEFLAELGNSPGRWARLYDFEEREDADKRANFIRSAAGKGWAVAVRHTPHGWSVFASLKVEAPSSGEDAVPQ